MFVLCLNWSLQNGGTLSNTQRVCFLPPRPLTAAPSLRLSTLHWFHWKPVEYCWEYVYLNVK